MSIIGGLIALNVFLHNKDIQCSLDQFRGMAKRIFPKTPASNQNLTSRMRRLFNTLISDGYYDASTFKECLKEAFGSERRMFDSPQQISGSKVAVTALNISDGSVFLFSNYNGIGHRKSNKGRNISIVIGLTITNLRVVYNMIRPEQIKDEPLMWTA